MRTVLNEFQCPWNIGDTLACADDDNTEIVIVGLRICPKTMCKPVGKCTHLKIEDDEGDDWCGLIDDFEVIR